MQLHQLEGDHEALLHMPFQSLYMEQYHSRNEAEDVFQAQTTHKTSHAAHRFMNMKPTEAANNIQLFHCGNVSGFHPLQRSNVMHEHGMLSFFA